jgi:hypothetical protein
MSEKRPSGGELDGAAQLLASARARVSAAAADLAIAGELRLTERQRATLSALLPRLLRSIEDELRAALVGAFDDPALDAALSSAHLDIAGPILDAAGASTDPMLLAALLRRAEEHRLHRGATLAGNSLLIDLAGDRDPAIASEAMALLIAQSGRFDRFQEPLLVRSDLPAELEHHLVWTVAAALRLYAVQRHRVRAAEVDDALAAAAIALLARYDEGDTLDAHCLRLARALRDAGRLDDVLVARALAEAGLPLFLGCLSVRIELDMPALWEIMLAPGGHGAALLLRAAGVGRDTAGEILLGLIRDQASLVPQLDHYDGLSAADAEGTLALWRADPLYRAAVARLAS